MSLDPNKPASPWKDETLLERVARCRAMLFIHGFMTDAESRKVNDRINKWVKRTAKGAKS